MTADKELLAIEGVRERLQIWLDANPGVRDWITFSTSEARATIAAIQRIEQGEAPLSATATTGEFVSVPKEPTLEMWDAAWKSIGLPYRAKLSLHEIKTLFEKFHAAMLAAAPVDSQGTAPRVEGGATCKCFGKWEACELHLCHVERHCMKSRPEGA